MNDDPERAIGNDGNISWRASGNSYIVKNCLIIIYNGARIEIGCESGRADLSGFTYSCLPLYQFRRRNRVIGWIALQYPKEWELANGGWAAASQKLQQLRMQQSSALTRTYLILRKRQQILFRKNR